MGRKPRTKTTVPTDEPKPDIQGSGTATRPSNAMELAGVVSDRVQLLDLGLISCTSHRADDVPDGELRVVIMVKGVMAGLHADENKLLIRPTFSLTGFAQRAGESGETVAVSIEATFVIVYSCEKVREIARENIEAFANTNAIFNVWPFWREFVLNLTSRMRMSPVVVPVFRL